MIKIPLVPCKMENHQSMPFQYVCTDALCLKNTQELACLYCCQELHHHHIDQVKALKVVVMEVYEALEETEYGAGSILVNGIKNCRSENDLRQNITEVIGYHRGQPKFERLLDKDFIENKEKTRAFYENRAQKEDQQLQKTVKKKKADLHKCSLTAFIQPILTFTAEDAAQQGYRFQSPFSVAAETEKLVTAYAYPPLNRFQDSVEASLKVERVSPFWLGIGVSLGRHKYEDKSKNHIILTSNGWISVLGQLQQTPVKYCSKDTVRVKWDKRLSLIEFNANKERQTVELPMRWNQDIHLCVVLYYKDDCVQIMAA